MELSQYFCCIEWYRLKNKKQPTTALNMKNSTYTSVQCSVFNATKINRKLSVNKKSLKREVLMGKKETSFLYREMPQYMK